MRWIGDGGVTVAKGLSKLPSGSVKWMNLQFRVNRMGILQSGNTCVCVCVTECVRACGRACGVCVWDVLKAEYVL